MEWIYRVIILKIHWNIYKFKYFLQIFLKTKREKSLIARENYPIQNAL